MTGRTYLLLVSLLSLPSANRALTAAGKAPASRPLVGAILWDAWTGGVITEQVARTLGPAGYHCRLPWFATVLGENRVRIDGGRQSVMDREIRLAAGAGLDYWAFLLYPEDSPMSVALNQYRESRRRGALRFCLILHNTLFSPPERWPRERDRIAALVVEDGYLAVAGGRPLVCIFSAGKVQARRAGRVREVRSLLANCRKRGPSVRN